MKDQPRATQKQKRHFPWIRVMVVLQLRKREVAIDKQYDRQVTASQRPSTNDSEAWKAHWLSHWQPWRIEPEIDPKRQSFLVKCLSIRPDFNQGIYPFKNVKLNRGDVEWLLEAHHNKYGLISWYYEGQRINRGLDLRGADLSYVNLSGLTLSGLVGSIPFLEGRDIASKQQIEITEEIHKSATINLRGANLFKAHLEEASLIFAHLEGANLEGAFLRGAHLNGARLEEAILRGTDLEQADLRYTHLEKALLYSANLAKSNLHYAHLEGAHLDHARLEEADLSDSFLDGATRLNDIHLTKKHSHGAFLVDIHWNDANLAVIDWSTISMLGEEARALKVKIAAPYQTAIRSNRQLAVALRNQGLNEYAARFAYRAQRLQCKLFWFQGRDIYVNMSQSPSALLQVLQKYGQYFFSLFLDLIAGYGYKPLRSFIAYLIVIIGFATGYFWIGHTVGPTLSPLGAFVFSMTSFHGRGFFPGGIKLDDPLTVLAAIEAFIGLLIEVTFIATLTQRLFGK
jgi:uncharacterized protein YjbI with pentapeptide repeats